MSDITSLVKQLNEIGIALSAEQDGNRLMELILGKAMEITGADAGTLYTRESNDKQGSDCLNFAIMRTRSLGFHQGGGSGRPIELPPICLYDAQHKPNLKMVAACAVLEDRTINLPDAYQAGHYDFSGTRRFDENFGYHSKSFVTVPMRNHENEIIGVLQLINKLDPLNGRVLTFSQLDQELLESLASQAAVAMSNQNLIRSQRELFDSFIQLIAHAIDQKSPYTGGHCRRVPELTMMLARATCRMRQGPLQDFDMDEDDMYELEVAGWLHDCGKIAIPEYVIDKATKLETIYNRLETVETRLEVLRRDAIIAAMARLLPPSIDRDASLHQDPLLSARLEQLEDYRRFLRVANVGGESMEDADLDRIDSIASERWQRVDGQECGLLSEDEQENLKIRKGTLLPRERQIINSHMQITIDMLEALPYPKYLKRVPEYAGGHHEKMDGTGFPKGLTREQMSVPARMMAIADIFEALTARDRPYKKAMPLSQALTILGRMKLDNHIDPDLFDVFIHEKVYLEYSRVFLGPDQIDQVDVTTLPGYNPSYGSH